MSVAIALPQVRPRHALAAVVIIVCSIFLCPAGRARAGETTTLDLPDADELVERYIAALGGRTAMEALHSRGADARIVTDLQWDRHIHEVDTLSAYGLASGEYLVVTRSEEGVTVEGFDGVARWKVDVDGTVSDGGGDPLDRWMADPQFPLKLREHYPDMRSTGVETWNEDTIYVLDVGLGESHRLGFDPETGLLIRMGYKTWIYDYQEIDSVLVPRRIVHGRKGGSTTFVLDSVSHNITLDPSIFALAR